jgi:hypothetical protein
MYKSQYIIEIYTFYIIIRDYIKNMHAVYNF